MMRAYAPIGVRMSPSLKNEVKAAAKKHQWSMNAFVVFAVQEQLKREKREGQAA